MRRTHSKSLVKRRAGVQLSQVHMNVLHSLKKVLHFLKLDAEDEYVTQIVVGTCIL